MKRISQKIRSITIDQNDNVEEAWQNPKTNITNAASEVLEYWKVNINNQPERIAWFTEEMKEIVRKELETYLNNNDNKNIQTRLMVILQKWSGKEYIYMEHKRKYGEEENR